ncbi:unannotated protein [freshwater metagenome]|uniref:Unannotated protein n=1 Tax=freshwater metagenome TaxID=449393 RepID=A0A6J6GFB6_9ZZZZ|nr:hypothetical protein [Actinomycetota bacterium]
MTTHRVTVRGRFGPLSDDARSQLRRHLDEHDILLSAYTAEGTLTYDHRIDFFNLRYEITGEPDSDSAGSTGLDRAERFLSVMGWSHRGLKATVVDMSEVWRVD